MCNQKRKKEKEKERERGKRTMQLLIQCCGINRRRSTKYLLSYFPEI